jgi:multidrug efflux pump subunit AcrA (membrane-fusion protein)
MTATSTDQSTPRLRLLPLLARAVVSLAFIAAGVGIFSWLYVTRAQPPASDPSATGRLRLLVSEPLELEVGRRFRAFGQARAHESADVPARVSAPVAKLHPNYREGATVAAGEPLVSLDESDFQRQLAIADEAIKALDAQLGMLALDESSLRRGVELAEEDATLAKDDLERVRAAAAQDAAVAREVDRARGAAILAERAVIAARDALEKLPLRRAALVADRARQESSRELARLSLERSTIVSPMAGVVQFAELDVGEMASPGVRVARVVDPSRVEIPILLPASARTSVAAGDRVVLRADRAGAEAVEARVTRIAPEDDPATRTMTVFAEGEGSRALAPGSFVEAEVSARASGPRTVVPRRAVSGGRLLTVRDGVVRGMSVIVEFSFSGTPAPTLPDTEWVVLAEPLPKGTLVVLDGSRRIAEGAPVTAIRPGAESTADLGAGTSPSTSPSTPPSPTPSADAAKN